jgi:hypothetical protein
MTRMHYVDMPLSLGDLTKTALAGELKERRSLAFARWLSCLSIAGSPEGASRRFLDRFPTAWGASEVEASLKTFELKSGVPPGTTTDPGWAQPLTGVRGLASGFAAIARSASLLGRLPGVRTVPFATRVPTESQGANFGWVSQGNAALVTQMSFGTGAVLDLLTATGIITFTREFLKLAIPGSDVALRDALVAAITEFTDRSMIDPSSTAIAGQRPGSITSTLTPISAPGPDMAADMSALLQAFFQARPGASDATRLIASADNSRKIRMANNGAGVGVDVVTTGAAGSTVVVLDGQALYVADDGIVIDSSGEASLQMDSAPDAPPTAATIQTSLWMSNLVAFKLDRRLNWTVAPNGAQYMVVP